MTSEEISSILDGDILVTHLDNIEVWVMLLNKVSLPQVEMFTRLPTGVANQAFENAGKGMGRGEVEPGGDGDAAGRGPDLVSVSGPHVPRPPSSRPALVGHGSRAAARSRGLPTGVFFVSSVFCLLLIHLLTIVHTSTQYTVVTYNLIVYTIVISRDKWWETKRRG